MTFDGSHGTLTGGSTGHTGCLVPTGAERRVRANGNDHLLTVVDVGGARVGVTAFLRGGDVPRDLANADAPYVDENDFMSRGNTSIVAPGGQLVAGLWLARVAS